MIIERILEALRTDPKYAPMHKKHLHIYDRIQQTLVNFPKKKPTLVTRLILARHKFLKSKPKLTWVKTKLFLLRLHLSKKYQSILFRSFHRQRRAYWVVLGLFGFLLGDAFSYAELLPGHVPWAFQFRVNPHVHYLLPYILEGTHHKNMPDYMKKDDLAQSMERLMNEETLDTLSWLTLGSYFAAIQESELSFLASHMAHLKDHKVVGGNSLQPFEMSEAPSFFRSS